MVLRNIAETSILDVADAQLRLQRSGLKPADFHLPSHICLFKAFDVLLNEEKHPIDPITVKALLEAKGWLSDAGGWEKVLSVIVEIGHLSDSSFDAYCGRVRTLATRRNVVRGLREALAKIESSDSNPARTLGDLHATLSTLVSSGQRTQSLREIMDFVCQEYDQRQSGDIPSVIPTGIAELDEIIGGWQPTLNLLGALPGVGKSAVIASSVRSIAMLGHRVGVFSLEDEASWLGWRLWSHEASVDHFVLKFLKNSERAKEKANEGLDRLDAYWDNVVVRDGSDTSIKIEDIVADAHRMILHDKVEIIFVDHLGEIAYDGSSERYDLAVASHLSALRSIANTHGVPVVVAAHLRRRQGLGTDSEPTLQDFANSAGAERKARVAIGLSRASGSDIITFSILKNTNGKSGFKVEVPFMGASAMLATAEQAAIAKSEREAAQMAENEKMWKEFTRS
jgi:replicative DNA helicase